MSAQRQERDNSAVIEVILLNINCVSTGMTATYMLSFLGKTEGGREYPSILWGCMWILTWAWDRTSSSRLNNFYKKGKGRKKKNIWILITYGRQIQNETVIGHGHATDNAYEVNLGNKEDKQNPPRLWRFLWKSCSKQKPCSWVTHISFFIHAPLRHRSQNKTLWETNYSQTAFADLPLKFSDKVVW